MSETKNLKLYKHDEPLESNENAFDIDKALSKNWDKVDEYVGKVNTKIQTLETENTKNKQDISNIQTEQETQNINIESLQKENAEIKEENNRLREDLNAFPSVSGSGEYVILDTADSRFKKLKVTGKSWQETRSGENAISSVYSSIGSNQINWSIDTDVLTSNIMYFSLICSVALATTNRIYIKDGNTVIVNKGPITLDANNKKVIKITLTDEEFEQLKSATNAILQLYENNTDIDYTNVTFSEVMLSTSSDNNYEKYGAMPSAKFPSEIRNVGDNGNLYDKDNPNVLDTPIDSNGLGGNVKNTYKTVWIPCKPNTTYTVSKKYDATKNRFALAYTSEEPNYSQQVEGYTSNMYASSLTIKTNLTAKYLLVYVWIAGGSVTYQEMLDSIKIEKGTQATVDNGHGLGSMEIVICNKNILNQDLELFQGNYDNNGNVITNSDRRIDKYIFLAKGNYILWSTSNNWINVLIYDKNKKLLSVKNSNTNKELAFTLDEDGYIRFGFNPIIGNLDVFQLERNTEKTTSEEHKQQIIVFPLEQEQRLMEGDYLAEDGIHHKRKQTVLDGTENWVTLTAQKGDDTSYFYCTKTDMKKASSITCNQFINRAVWSTDVEGIQSITDNLIRLRINTSRASTVLELKAWLAAQKEAGTPVTVEYELVEEEVEPYTEAQKEAWKQIKNTRSYEGQTNIFSTDEISPNFEVTARRDLNAILNSLQAQILAN